MAEDQKLLTETEAQKTAGQFLLSKHFNSKISFNNNQLITKEHRTLYLFHGRLIMQSRGLLDRFISDKTANKYEFMIEIDAQQGHIIKYEIT
jgi:hypothetical protein